MRFDDKQTALDYEQRLAAEGYPGMLLEAVFDALGGGNSIIDVGAGTGFFTIPLAERGYLVHAIEPSREMGALLRKKIRPELESRITIHGCRWEDWCGERSERLVCVHSIYPMKDPLSSIKKMSRFADRTVMVVRADEGIRSISLLLRGVYDTNRCSPTSIRDVRGILDELNIGYSAEAVIEKRDFVIKDLNREVDYYRRHLGLGDDTRDDIRRIIAENSDNIKGNHIFHAVLKDWVIVFSS